MDKKFKQSLFLVAFGIILFAIIMNLGAVIGAVTKILGIVSSVIIGFLLAFILDVPMRGFEKMLKRLIYKKKKPSASFLRITSLILTLLSVIMVIVLVCTLVIPIIISNVVNLYQSLLEKIPQWITILAECGMDTEIFASWINSFDIQSIVETIGSSATNAIGTVIAIVMNTVSSVASFIISFILGIYVLLAKHDLARQSKRLMYAFIKKDICDYIIHAFKLLSDTFSKFLSGQCVEAVILGCLVFIANAMFGVPYAALIGVLTGVMAFVPYVGAMLSCIIGSFLVAIVAPDKIIVCIAIYVVIQFIETQFIYPHVVGTSVGLSPLWTLIAVLIGGNLFGLFGMIFFIPLMAAALQLLREHVEKREQKQKEMA